MATKKTPKRMGAIATLRGIGQLPKGFNGNTASESLYAFLESVGWWWDSDAQIWKDVSPPSTSMFKDDEGNPSGVLRVRLMGMPPDADAFTKSFKVKGWTLIDKSSAYPNRKGPGSRWYLTYKRD